MKTKNTKFVERMPGRPIKRWTANIERNGKMVAVYYTSWKSALKAVRKSRLRILTKRGLI